MTASRDRELRDGLEAIQADMAEHQRNFAAEVTGEANRELAAQTFAEIDARGGFDAPPATPAPAPAPEPQLTRQQRRLLERQERDVAGRKYVVTKDDEVVSPELALAGLEREHVVKALQRLHMLLSLKDTGILGAPSWSQRATAVMATMVDPKSGGTVAERRVRFAQELDALLEDSSRLFGDWRADPDRKLYVGA